MEDGNCDGILSSFGKQNSERSYVHVELDFIPEPLNLRW